MQDFGAGIQPGRNNGIEIIDIVFAFSNVKLVRELVEDNLKRLGKRRCEQRADRRAERDDRTKTAVYV